MAQLAVDDREAVQVALGAEMAGSNVLLRCVGGDVFLGAGSNVTSSDGLQLKAADGIVTIPLDDGDALWAICASGAGTNEEQQVSTDASSGTFTLDYDGDVTAGIDVAATSADVRAALVALANIGASDVNVTGPAGGPWVVEFIGALAETNVPEMTADSTGLTGGTATVTTTRPGVAGSSSVVSTYVG